MEDGSFRFTGVDIKKTDDGITLSMEDYAKSIELVEDIRKAKGDELLTTTEMMEHGKN